MNINKLNKKLILEIKKKKYISNKLYISALEKTHRHQFLDHIYKYNREKNNYIKIDYNSFINNEELMQYIYSDRSLVFSIKDGGNFSISQPSVIAAMIELAEIKKGEKILEIGTGSGFNASLLTHIVGKKGYVFSIEIDKEIFAYAKRKISENNIQNLYIANQDGGYGLKDFMPYDKIIVSCATADIPVYWVEQLKVGGILVAPLVTNGLEIIIKLRKTNKQLMEGNLYHYVHFYKMQGSFTILSHYAYTKKELKTLDKIIKKHSKIDAEFSDQLKNLSKRMLNDFFLYLALHNKKSLCYYDSDDFGTQKGYGLMAKSNKMTSIAMIIDKKLYYWGNIVALKEIKKEFKKFSKNRYPLNKYTLKVYPSNFEKYYKDNDIVIERKNSITVFSVND